MVASPAQPAGVSKTVDLQTLVATVGNAVQAQNGIATNIKALITAFTNAYPPPLSGSATWDPPSLANGASETTTVTVAGAVLGNYVQASFSLNLQGLTLTAYVSAADTITAVLNNATGGAIDLASGTLKVRVTTV